MSEPGTGLDTGALQVSISKEAAVTQSGEYG